MTFTLSWAWLLAQFGITAVGAGLVAWGAFRWLGKRWLESKFAERLETFKHAKNREIETLRGEVNALLDRTVKLHALEFEVLPLAWDKLTTAYGAARRVSSRGQSYPDVSWLAEAPLAALLSKLDLEEHQQDEIKSIPTSKAVERQAALNKVLSRKNLQTALEARSECHNYLVLKGIFIEPSLKAQLKQLTSMIWDALEEREFDMFYPEPGTKDRWVKADALAKAGHELYEEIEKTVQARLWERKLLGDDTSA